MKNQKILLSMGVVLAVLLIMGGCTNSTSSDSKSDGRGVLGQISGVVYDTVTAQPIKDVTVEIATTSTKTDANGAFLFKDVGPGVYTVSFQKEGFQFRSKNIEVDAKEYIDDNPFLEVGAFAAQIEAIKLWIAMLKDQGTPVFPDSATNSGESGATSNDWQYTGSGIYVNGDGTTVEVKQKENKQFEVKEIKMNYTYKKALPLYVTGLAPLTGAIKAQIMLFTTPKSEDRKEKLEVAVPIKDGVEFWFVESTALVQNSPIGFGGNGAVQPDYGTAENPPAATAIASSAKYGPFFSKGGSIAGTGLPVGIALTLVSNGFLLERGGANYYFTGAAPYTYNFNGYYIPGDPDPIFVSPGFQGIAAGFFVAQNNSVDNKVQNYTDKGTIYMFSQGNFAIITGIVAGDPITPLLPTDAISLTFSEAIDPSTFVVSLEVTGNVKGPAVGGNLPLTAEWDADFTTVTLKPTEATEVTGGLRPVFPYSNTGTSKIGNLIINGKSVSGARIYATGNRDEALANGIPVFTQEGLKLIDVDLNPAEGRAIVTASKVKLYFNKAISTNSRFYFTTTDNAVTTTRTVEYSLADGNTSALISTDLLRTGPDTTITFLVYSEADPIGDAPITTPSVTNLTKLTVERLRLTATNIYAGGFVSANGAYAYFPINGSITLTFDRDIPVTAAEVKDVVKVSLAKTLTDATSGETNGIALAKSVSGNVLTLTPTVPLAYDTPYYLDVVISKSTDTWFRTSHLITNTFVAIASSGGEPPPAFTNIVFKTVHDPKATVHAVAAGPTSATSSEFTVVGGNVTGGTIVAGEKYYVQFDGDTGYEATALAYTAMNFTGGTQDLAATPTPNIVARNVLTSVTQYQDLEIVIGTMGTNIMTIQVNVALPTGAVVVAPTYYKTRTNYTGVGLKYAIGGTWTDRKLTAVTTDDEDYKNGGINTQSKQFNISGLTVNVE